MDHTVYERKNTDLGSTSMTKSGGFSIKKRHRKLGALIGLAALAVPFAANLGTLGDAMHAVTGPQNVYESELLNVKLKTSQDKTKTTWDLEFDRSETSVSEQTVKFKLDLDKAGLKDAEIKQDDKTLDMREGIVSAVLKSQSTHLILTAISTNEDKHDITLPVTELGLYDDKNGENKLPVDNRSVDLTMAFEKVAEIAKESSSSETVTEAVAEEEKQDKEVRIIDGDTNGLIPYDGSNPIDTLNTSLSTKPIIGQGAGQVQTVLIDRYSRTTAIDGTQTGKTSSENFQIWANHGSDTVAFHSNKNFSSADITSGKINIFQKFDRPSVKIDGGDSTTPVSDNTLLNNYHNQYQTNGGNNNQSSYMILFGNKNNVSQSDLDDKTFSILYDNVGSYVDYLGNEVQMGAVMTIGNIQKVSSDHDHLGTRVYIDVPNNLYSGILYQGIDSLDITVQFYVSSNGQFTNLLSVPTDASAQMTFDSLNNFGAGTGSQNVSNGFSWTETTYDISNARYAESVDKISGIKGTDAVANRSLAKEATVTSMKQDSARNGMWYSQGHGNYTNSSYTGTNWIDNIDDSNNTFTRGALSYPISGETSSFRLYTGTGNTWQTLTCASLNPLQLDAPRKLVTDDVLITSTADAANYNNAVGQLNSANGNAAVQEAIKTTREGFGEYDPKVYASYAAYVAARETAVNEAITATGVAYGNMYGQNLATKPAQTIGDVIYFNYDYWVMQPTYRIGTDSIAKPNEVVMTDTLDAGVTLRSNSKSDMKSFTSSDIIIYNTNGTAFAYGKDKDYTVELDVVEVNGEDCQKITVTFTEAGRNKMDFDGNNLAWNLNVHVPATKVLSTGVEGIWYNTANVMTGVNKPNGIFTNKVNVKLLPLHDNDLILYKVDDDAPRNQVNGVTFNLELTHAFNGWDGEKPTFTPLTDPQNIPGTSSSQGSTWEYDALNIGKYLLTETGVPGGYINSMPVLKDDDGKIMYDDNGNELHGIRFTVTETLGKDGKYTHTMSGDSDEDKKALIGLSQTKAPDQTTGPAQWTASIENPRVPTQFKLNKVDADGKALAGAKFQYALQSDAIAYKNGQITDNPWVDMTEQAGGVHTIADGTKLKFNQTYVVHEVTAPSGYAMEDDFYFIVVPQNVFSDPSFSYGDGPLITEDLNGTSANMDAPVNFLQVNEGGSYLKWLPAKEDTSTKPYSTWVGDFNVANSAKSIFPRVGGTGIQAYIGAGLIVMLIAGGAAWYIKRRQNQ